MCTLRRCKEFEDIGVQWVKGASQLADVDRIDVIEMSKKKHKKKKPTKQPS